VGLVSCGARTELDVPADASEMEAATFDAPFFVLDASADVKADVVGEDVGPPPTVRRPFLVGGSMRAGRVTGRADWQYAMAPCDLDERTRARLAETWANDGREEHASIAAFARFAMQLLALGAPPDLVAASQRAGLEEIRHAKACFALASRYAQRPIGPSTFALDGALEATSLVDVAALAAAEGCVGETLGVALAEEALAGARDEEVRRVLRMLVRDEAKHAELAWRFARWAVDQGGDPIRRAIASSVRQAIETTLAAPVRAYGVDAEQWRAHGRLTCEESRAIAQRAAEQVVAPCLDALTRIAA